MDIDQDDHGWMIVVLDKKDSSFILVIMYHLETQKLIVSSILSATTHYDVPPDTFYEFVESPSKGKYYNQFIKSNFKQSKKAKTMAQTVELSGSIDVTLINRDILLKALKPSKDGHTPIYMKVKVTYIPDGDKFGQNGFISQTLPKEFKTAQVNKETKILGNIKDFTDYQRQDLAPAGEESGGAITDLEESSDDLPF